MTHKLGDTIKHVLYEGHYAVYTVVGFDSENRPVCELEGVYSATESQKKTEEKADEPRQITIEETVKAKTTKKTTAKRK